MPWSVEERDGRYCVVKAATGNPVPGGCHATRAEAVRHQKALYANESPAMSASAIPLKPPTDWFQAPEPDHPEPLTVEADGRVHGHLAPWEGCHAGLVNGAESSCVRPPRSVTDYKMFHLGQLETAEGSMVPVGKIVLGTGHADLRDGLAAATAHYDQTGKVGAFVRARNGRHGIYLAGAARSDLPAELLRDLRANLPSGDWRLLDHNLELVAALSVPVPGFGIPAMVASTDAGEIMSMILAGDIETEDEMEDVVTRGGPDYIAGKRRIESELTAAVLTTKRREALKPSDFAIPEDRSYPIYDQAHARNALARSSGKPEEARVRRAVCRRFPDIGECGS